MFYAQYILDFQNIFKIDLHLGMGLFYNMSDLSFYHSINVFSVSVAME